MAHKAFHPGGVFAPHALLPDGWEPDVELRFDEDGRISEIRRGMSESRFEQVEGPVVAGMPNVHSHAFQRLLVGRTQELTGLDDFWSWRTTMYSLVEAIEPDELSAISAWVYAEMLASGYTSVAEFHYLFNDREGMPYADRAELPLRAAAGAADAGIGLTLVHMVSIPISNASVNPARSLATAVFQGDWALGQVWAFLLFPAIGALLAGAIWYVIDDGPATADESGAAADAT